MTDKITKESSIDELELSIRTYNILKRYGGIETIGQLLALSDEKLMKIRNLGKKGVNEIKSKLEGIKLDSYPDVYDKMNEILDLEKQKAQLTKPNEDMKKITENYDSLKEQLTSEINELSAQKEEKEKKLAILIELWQQKEELKKRVAELDKEISKLAKASSSKVR